MLPVGSEARGSVDVSSGSLGSIDQFWVLVTQFLDVKDPLARVVC